MTPTKLRFRARGTALVQDYDRFEQGVRAFLGRKYVEVEPGRWGFAPTGAEVEVPYRAEYVKACADGDLWPADAATASACGVAFDPTFGAAAKTDSTLGGGPPPAADKTSGKAGKGA